MDVSGKWKIKAAMKFDPEKGSRQWKTTEEILADPETDDSDKKSLASVYIFGSDGFIRVGMPLPEDMPKDELDELLESGEFELTEDNYLIVEKKAWKEEDGKLMIDTGAKGTVLGEEISPWGEIKVDGDDLIMFAYRLTRA